MNDFETEPAQFSRISGIVANMNKIPASENSNMRLRTQVKLFNSYLQALCEKSKISKRPLAMLLHLFPGRECEIPRDRIYSLLSIASDAESFPVDYGSKEGTVLSNALDHLSRSMCLCSWLNIVNALECGSASGVLECDKLVPVTSLSMSPCLPRRSLKVLKAVGKGSTCRYCDDQLQGEGEKNEVYCTRQICKAVDATHFSLIPLSSLAPTETRFKNQDLVAHRSKSPVYYTKYGWKTSEGPRSVEITASIFIQFMRSSALSRKDGKLSDIYQVPLELCQDARAGRGLSAFHAYPVQEYSSFNGGRLQDEEDAYIMVPVQILTDDKSVDWKANLKSVLRRNPTTESISI